MICETYIDECIGVHDCQDICNNEEGGYSCACSEGYELDEEGYNCTDIDECSGNVSVCDSTNGMCNNSIGSYICSCNNGYELANDSSTCNVITTTMESPMAGSTATPQTSAYGSTATPETSAPGSTGTPDTSTPDTTSTSGETEPSTTVGGTEPTASVTVGGTESTAPATVGGTEPTVSVTVGGTGPTASVTVGGTEPTASVTVGGPETTTTITLPSSTTLRAVTCNIPATLPAELSSSSSNIPGCSPGGTILNDANSCVYECPTGYNVSATTPISCGSDGMLSSALPTCTDIDECFNDPSLCNNGGCLNTAGSYICICNPGFVLIENSCSELSSTSLFISQVVAIVTGESLNNETLIFTAALTDSTSQEFKDLEIAFCNVLLPYLINGLASTPVSTNCFVQSFTPGSVVGRVQVGLAANSQAEADSLAMDAAALTSNVDLSLSANGQSLVTSSISANVVGAEGRLSTGAVIGIALGTFGFVLVIISCVCCVYVQGVRHHQATKIMLSRQRYDESGRGNGGFFESETWSSGQDDSLDERRYAVGQALDRIWRDDNTYFRDLDSEHEHMHYDHHADGNFGTPYVVDGTEASYAVERNPMHY